MGYEAVCMGSGSRRFEGNMPHPSRPESATAPL
jgi:hypothetical protein